MTKLGMNRRNFLSATGGAVAAPFIITRADAADPRELRIFTPGGTWKDRLAKYFFEPFFKEHNITADWKVGEGPEPLIVAQRRRPQWDLVQSNSSRAPQMGAIGLYRRWDKEIVPSIEKIHPAFRSDYLAGHLHTPYGISFNSKQIKKPIQSWQDLWDPEFKGKVGFPTWPWVGKEVFYAINQVFGGTVDNIDPGIKKMRELVKTNECKIIANIEQCRQLLQAGEILICPNYAGRSNEFAKAGIPVDFVMPKEGGLTWSWNVALVANRPEENMALSAAFVDTTLDAERQIEFARASNYPPTNIEAMKNLPKDLQHLKMSMEDIEGLTKLQNPDDAMAQFMLRDQHTERWNKDVLG